MFCQNCGEKIAEGSGFCKNCGAPTVIAPVSQSNTDLPSKGIPRKSGFGVAMVWIVAVLFLIGFFYFVSQSGSSTPSTTTDASSNTSANATPPAATNNNETSVNSADQASDVALKSKCASDGQTFVQNYENGYLDTTDRIIWFSPQYHYNSNLNTCLAYISYNQILLQPTAEEVASDYYTQIIDNNNIVFDIYSNQAILQNEESRTYNYNGTSNPPETDTLDSYPLYQNIPNSNDDTFNSQLKVLMNG